MSKSISHSSPIALALLLITLPAHAEQLSDPTRRPDAPSAGPATSAVSGWALQSTRITPRGRSAIINGETVTEGARVGGARVRRIEHARVELDKDGRRFTVTMFDAIGKTPVTLRGRQE